MNTRSFLPTNYAVDSRTTIYFITIFLIIYGIVSYYNTPKESFPEVVFPYFSVSAIYPGTSPADMENLVTRPIEKELKTVKGIKQISSNSIQDFSLIMIEFETNIDNSVAYQDVKDAVDDAISELPTDLLDDPTVTKIDLSEFPILNINLSGDLGLEKIKSYADDLQDRIEGMEEVTRVDIVGALEREFQINVDLYKMQAAGISFDEIESAVAFENLTISGGQLNLGGMERTMRIVGEFNSIEDLKNILVRDGIYLKDIAQVIDSYADRESFSRLMGEDVITLNVIKKSGQNLINTIDKIKIILEEFEAKAPANLAITVTGDNSKITRNTLASLFNTIILGFLIVVLVLMFFMGVDNSLFVAISIPLSILITFIIIHFIGYTLNMVVLMAFILVLGIVVDNSIVVVENIYRHFMTTKNLAIKEASKIGVGEVARPVFSGTITTMAPFFPLAFWPGIMGEFMVFIPVTIIVTLFASMLVAYFINPVFAVSFMKYRGEKGQSVKNRNREVIIVTLISVILAFLLYLIEIIFAANLIIFILLLYLLVKFAIIPLIKKFQKVVIPEMTGIYKRSITFFLKGHNAYIVMAFTVILLVFTFFLMGVFPPRVIMFPEGDPDETYIFITMPAGTRIEVTDSVTKIVEDKVFNVLGEENPDIESVISNVAINAGEDVFQRSTQAKLAKVTVSFVEYQYRKGIPTIKYTDMFRDSVKNIPGAKIIVSNQQMGPPTGKPINIEISGEDFNMLIPYAEHLNKFIDSLNVQGIEDLKMDIEVNNPEILINIDRTKANKLGIKSAYIGMMLRTALFGKDISKYREGDDEYDIKLRLQEKYRDNLQTLMNMKLIIPGGENGIIKEIPITAVADINYSSSYGGIIRKDHNRVITLSSNVLTGYNANEIVNRLKTSLKDFVLDDGYEISFTGEQEEQAENSSFLTGAFILAVMLILIILIIQFNSIAKPLIILVQIVFSLIGVLLGNIIFGLDISVIMTGMGIIAVGGIVVKNAIILIDYIDILISKGMEKKQAIITAGSVRLTPVFLTAASTILGLLPLAIGMNIDFPGLFTAFDPNIYFGGTSAIFWKPLAWTIIFGLTFATFLTLIVVPSMYYIICKKK